MTRPLTLLLLILGSPAFADPLHLAGEQFQPKVSVVWTATNVLPETLTVYKVVPQQLSKAVISNAMALANFKPINRINPGDKNSWEFRDNKERPRRFLRIVPGAGWIWYLNEDAKAPTVSAIKGVPAPQELSGLLYGFLPKFGITTNDLRLKPEMRTEEKGQHLAKRGGTWTEEKVFMRGISLPRQIDAIPLRGSGAAGGISMQFVNDAKIFQFEFVWRKYEPFERRKIVSKDEILSRLKAGKAVRSVMEDDLTGAAKFEVTGVELFYGAMSPMEG